MNCSDVQNQFGNAIDRALSPNVRDEFFKHLSVCQGCRKEYELESITKRVVQKTVKRASTPANVRSFVLDSLREEFSSASDRPPLVERMFGGRRLFPSLVTALGVIAFVYYLVPLKPSASHLTVHTASNDIILQTLQNFAKIREGLMKPKAVACDPTIITSYFQKTGLQFAAETNVLKDCDWYGASTSEFGGIQLAHIVYQTGDDVTYVYQVKKEEAMLGSKLSMPEAAKESLEKTGWYTDPLHPDCNVVVWTSNGALCSAASTMKKDRLLALFASQ